MTLDKLVLASGNKGKLKEFGEILSPLNIRLHAQSEFDVSSIPETGLTFVENAILKARHAAKITGLPALADDSGLVVDALNGAPGIYSARYAGVDASDKDNVQKLLNDLADVKQEQRDAYFFCTLVLLRHADDPTPLIAQGRWHGTIATVPKGDGGFGYDPVFYLSNLKCTAAELERAQKNQISHRGKAVADLLNQLKPQS